MAFKEVVGSIPIISTRGKKHDVSRAFLFWSGRGHLGLTLLPRSGVSLVFAGIAVSILEGSAPKYAPLIQGTIAAAAGINEIIAVFMAKKGFEWPVNWARPGSMPHQQRRRMPGRPVPGNPPAHRENHREGIRFRVPFLI